MISREMFIILAKIIEIKLYIKKPYYRDFLIKDKKKISRTLLFIYLFIIALFKVGVQT